jgi:rhodanese-related sulfurtransferase
MSIILVTSPNCRFCMASRKFHSMLSREALERGISFYVAVPSVDAAQAYIRDAGIVGPSRSWSDLSFRVVSTPTLVLVDSVSTAKAILVGQLPEASETEVLRIVKDPAELDSAGFIDGQMRITAAQLSELQTRDKATLVDVRERPQYQIWHREGAINIPLLELPVRAPFELDATGLLVVDCSQVSTSSCASMMKSAAHVAPRTAALSEGLVFGSCQVSRTTETR